MLAVALAVVGGVVYSNLRAGGGVPWGIYGVGLVGAAPIVMSAVGLVLVYRANRVINFAQPLLAATGAALYVDLAQHRTFLVGLRRICPGCLPGDTTEQALKDAPYSLVIANQWVSLLVGVLAASALVWLVYVLILKRFKQAPRLVLTFVTLGAGAFGQAVGLRILSWVYPEDPTVARAALVPLVGLHVRSGPAVLDGTDLVSGLIALLGVGGVALYLSRSRAGAVMRGAADNPARAETLGVNVTSLNARAWVAAGGLAGLGACLSITKAGASGLTVPAVVAILGGTATLVAPLVAALAGAFVSLAKTLVTGIAVAIITAITIYASGSPAAASLILLVLALALLLVQRSRSSRAQVEAEAGWQATRELRPIPAELRSLPAVRRVLMTVGLVGLVVALAFPWVMSPSQTILAADCFAIGIVTLSVLILTGWAGQISLAQMAFAGLGGWLVGVAHWPFLPALLLAGATGAIAAVVFGFSALQLRGQNLAVLTLILAGTASSFLFDQKQLGSHLPGHVSRPFFLGLNLGSDRAFYYLAAVFLALTLVAVMGMRRSRTARALIACKDNERAAQAFGINLLRAKLSAFALSGALAGFAGGLIVYAESGVHPEAFSPEQGITIFLLSLIGGFGVAAGPLIGMALYLLLSLLAPTSFGAVTNVLLDPRFLALLVLSVFPGGLSQLTYDLRNAWLRRLADRHHIVVPSLVGELTEADLAQAPIEPNVNAGGGTVFVPQRYRLDDQWIVEARRKEAPSHV